MAVLTACTGGGISDPALAPFNAQVTLTVAGLQAEQTQVARSQDIFATEQAERETQRALDEQFAQATLSAARTQDVIQATREADQATATAELATYLLFKTQTAEAYLLIAEAKATEAAWLLTATPLAATQNAVTRADRESELRAHWNEYVIPSKAILPSVLIFLVVALVIAAAIQLFPRLASTLEALEMLLRTHKNRAGEVDTLVINGDQNVRTISPQRALGHATRNTVAGVLVDRTPDGAEWQDRVTSREQMIRLAQAVMQNQPAPKRVSQRLLKTALLNQGGQQLALPKEEGNIDAEVVILPPEDPDVREILADVEPKLIHGEFK